MGHRDEQRPRAFWCVLNCTFDFITCRKSVILWQNLLPIAAYVGDIYVGVNWQLAWYLYAFIMSSKKALKLWLKKRNLFNIQPFIHRMIERLWRVNLFVYEYQWKFINWYASILLNVIMLNWLRAFEFGVMKQN